MGTRRRVDAIIEENAVKYEKQRKVECVTMVSFLTRFIQISKLQISHNTLWDWDQDILTPHGQKLHTSHPKCLPFFVLGLPLSVNVSVTTRLKYKFSKKKEIAPSLHFREILVPVEIFVYYFIRTANAVNGSLVIHLNDC